MRSPPNARPSRQNGQEGSLTLGDNELGGIVRMFSGALRELGDGLLAVSTHAEKLKRLTNGDSAEKALACGEVDEITQTISRLRAIASESAAAVAAALSKAKGFPFEGFSVGSFREPLAERRNDGPEEDQEGSQPASAELRGLIVDADPRSRAACRALLQGLGGLTIVGEGGSVAEGRSLAAKAKPDFVFLEVALPDGCGFDLIPELKQNTAVVILTRAETQALRAFDCGVADFLVKPITPERMEKAVLRLRQRCPGRRSVIGSRYRQPDSLLVKTLTEKKLIKASEITHIAAYGEYSWVYWSNDARGAMLRKSLKHWLAELPGDRFIRVHRCSIVNLAYLKRVERLPSGRMQVHLRDTLEPILVSLRLAPVLNRKLKALARSNRAAKVVSKA